MSQKKLRNKPCPCGSGNKFKHCCMAGATEPPSIRPVGPEDIFAKMLQFKPQSQKADNAELEKLIRTYLVNHTKIELLFQLGVSSLLPENQAKEFRFVEIAQVAIPQYPIEGEEDGEVSLPELYKKLDELKGAWHRSIEIDTVDIIYISWVKFNGSYYRTFSGTLSESEPSLNNHLQKALALSPFLDEGTAKISSLLVWILDRTNKFIDATGLSNYESDSTQKYRYDDIYAKEDREVLESLQIAFTITKVEESPEIVELLSGVSKPLEDYWDTFDLDQSDIYNFPVIEIDTNTLAIPFPQLLLMAVIDKFYKEISESANTTNNIEDKNHDNDKQAVLKGLTRLFPEGSILKTLKLDGGSWADYCIKFDGKLIFISIASALDGQDISATTELVSNRLLEGYRKLCDDPNVAITTTRNVHDFRDILTKLEPIFIVIPSVAGKEYALGSNLTADNNVLEIIPYIHFSYLLKIVSSPLTLIRFLRAVHGLRDNNTRIIGSTILDLYGMYEKGGLNIVDLTQVPNVIVADLTAGTRLIGEKTKEFRNKYTIAEVGNKHLVLGKQYDHFVAQMTASDGLILHGVGSHKGLKLCPGVPPSDQEESSSMYLVPDSLCYFLDKKFSSLPSLKSKNLRVEFVLDKKVDSVQATVKSKSEDLTLVEFRVPQSAYKIFQDGTNSGERVVVTALLKALDCGSLLDSLIPASNKPNFQSMQFSLEHKAYENFVQPTRILPGDRWWVDKLLSSQVLASGTRPGEYTSVNDLAKYATQIKGLALAMLIERMQNYQAKEIIEEAYPQLEMIYVSNQQRQQEIIANTLSKGEGLNAEHIQEEQDSTQLSFATRLLIELAVQQNPSGYALLTDEAYTELLALAERVVDVDFWGDSAYLGLQSIKLTIAEGGYPFVDAISPESTKLSMVRIGHGLKDLRTRTLYKDGDVKEKDGKAFEEVAEKLDKAHEETFGFTLTERSNVCHAILEMLTERPSPLMVISKTMLVDQVHKREKLEKATVEKVIDSLTLSQILLKDKDISPSEKFWREEKIINKPLVAFPGHENILLFSYWVIRNSLLSFFDRLLTGRLEYLKNNPKSSLGVAITTITQANDTNFESKVAQVAKDAGWEAISQTHSLGGSSIPEAAGEIDGIFWSKERKIVLVVEAKNNHVSRSPKEIKTEIDNYFGRGKKPGYYAQLSRKHEWVKANKNLTEKQFNIDSGTQYDVNATLVTNTTVAASILKKPLHTTLTLDEFTIYLKDI
jgi:hypothetical protein